MPHQVTNQILSSENIFFQKKIALDSEEIAKILHNLYGDTTSIIFKIDRNLALLSIWKSILFGWNPYLTNWKIKHIKALWKKMQFFLLAITDALPGKKSEIKEWQYFFSIKKWHLFLKKLPKESWFTRNLESVYSRYYCICLRDFLQL